MDAALDGSEHSSQSINQYCSDSKTNQPKKCSRVINGLPLSPWPEPQLIALDACRVSCFFWKQ